MILGLSFFRCIQHLRSRFLQTYVGYLQKPCAFALLGSLSRCCAAHKATMQVDSKAFGKSNSFQHFWLLPKGSGFIALRTARLPHFIRDKYQKSRHVATTGRTKYSSSCRTEGCQWRDLEAARANPKKRKFRSEFVGGVTFCWWSFLVCSDGGQGGNRAQALACLSCLRVLVAHASFSSSAHVHWSQETRRKYTGRKRLWGKAATKCIQRQPQSLSSCQQASSKMVTVSLRVEALNWARLCVNKLSFAAAVKMVRPR